MSVNSPANQYASDEREQKCWDFYLEGINKNEPNAYAAAIKAGYSEDHARSITIQGWWKERISRLKRKDLLSKAEKKLEEILDLKSLDDEGKINVPLTGVQANVAKHVTSTLGKDEGYSTKQEVEHSGNLTISNILDQLDGQKTS